MAHNEIIKTIPRVVWDIIEQYSDVAISESPSNLEELCMLGAGEENRRFAAGVVRHLDSDLESQFGGVGEEFSLRRRGELMAYAGNVPHDVAQRGSIYESYLRAKAFNAQVFPQTVDIEIEGVVTPIVLDPVVSLENRVDVLTRPRADENVGTFMRDVVNPWTFRYLIRSIGFGWQVDSDSGDVYDAVRARRAFIICLKAHMLTLTLRGMMPGVEAHSVAGEVAGNKYLMLLDACYGWLCRLWSALLGVLSAVLGFVDLDWYHFLTPEFQAAVDVFVTFMLAAIVGRLFRTMTMEMPFKTVMKKGPNVYLGQLATEKGIIHRVRVNGRELELSAFPEMDGSHQDEMAMPSSEYFPCRSQPIGALLVTTNNTDLQLFGTFWRMDDYIVTARHCSNTLNQSTAVVYLATTRPTRKGNYEVDRSNVYKVPDDFFAPEENVIASYDIDAFAKELDEKTWSQIRLTKASTRIRSAYNQQVHSVGFTQDGLLVSASGKTLPNSGFEHLHHTASTQKGFSGSIILCGNSVVGMHVSAAGEHNVAVRTEMIQYLIDAGTGLESASKNRKKYTYADASYKEHYRQHKWRGGVADIKVMRDGKYSIVLQNGEATYGWAIRDLVECFGTGNAARDEDMFEDMLADSTFKKTYGNSGGRYIDFDDDRYHRDDYENLSIRSGGRNQRPRKRASRALVSKKEDMSWLYTEGSPEKPIHGPSVPKMQPESIQVIELFKERVEEFGYVEGDYAYPQMTPQVEKKSMELHLGVFGNTVRSVRDAPNEAEVNRCVALVTQKLESNVYVPDKDYNTIEGVVDVIHSSIISPNKAAGFPYVSEGMPLNGQVLESYGVKGFAQHVLNLWRDPFQIRMFLKADPTKKAKLAKEMPRLICNLPLHVTVKHAAIFKNFAFSCAKHFKDSPMMYAFSPANPGHLEQLKKVLPGMIWESDKQTWDYTFVEWLVEVCCRSTQNLALRHPDWTDEQFKAYLDDVREAFQQIFYNSEYRLTDGSTYRMQQAGIMKSGWFLTITINTMAQIAIDVMTQMRLGRSDEQILASPIVAGGDDVNQDPSGMDKERYVAAAADLGVKMEIHEREDLEHSEFFSSDIRRGPEGLEFHPKRWSKHIEHLKIVKVEHLADALGSHMENYRHSAAKFKLLEDMYHKMRETHPGLFPIEKLKSRQYLIAKQYGYEHGLFE
jgi:hypothetical protein